MFETNFALISELVLLEDAKKDAYVIDLFGEKLLAAAKANERQPPKTVEKLLDELNKADPNNGKNIVWIARMYTLKLFKVEDVARIKGEIEKFNLYKPKMANKDLNSFKTLAAFYDAVEAAEEEFGGESAEKSKKEIEADVKSNEVEWLIKTPNYKALIPKTVNASRIYGKGTKWCTASDTCDTHFKSYSSSGDLVIILVKEGSVVRKFQFHFSTNSFMDERDFRAGSADIKMLSSHPEHIDLLHILIEKHLG